MLNINMLSSRIKLRVLNQDYSLLIIAIDYYRLNNLIFEIKLIKKITQLNRFFNNLRLINILDFID